MSIQDDVRSKLGEFSVVSYIFTSSLKWNACSLYDCRMYSDMGDEISCDSYQATIPISNAFNMGKKRGKGREEGREREGERETKRGEREVGGSVINVLDSWHLL